MALESADVGADGEEGETVTAEEVWDELSSRFILNLPAEELQSFERLFFQIQQAYWFYEDFYADNYSHLQHYAMRTFTHAFFRHCSVLRPFVEHADALLKNFQKYMHKVPAYGAILVNDALDKVLLVQSWRSKSWTFPRGKVNEGESELACAIREVAEEIGFDVTPYVSEDQSFRSSVGGKTVKLFVAPGVPEDTAFEPQVRKEIRDIAWYAINRLPSKDNKSFWGVAPFLGKLKRWAKKRRRARSRAARKGPPAAAAAAAGGSGGGAGGAGAAGTVAPAVAATIAMLAGAAPPPTTTAAAPPPDASPAKKRKKNKKRKGKKASIVAVPAGSGGSSGAPAAIAVRPASMPGKKGKRKHGKGKKGGAAPSAAAVRNSETFGSSVRRWTPDEMFATNEKLIAAEAEERRREKLERKFQGPVAGDLRRFRFDKAAIMTAMAL
eukprot:PLAT4761.1.p1 GENE.PLAT4761.1~~PLAT4761.1.p1  ORF type:complete len:457 (+),score=143.62 PLAT4761.1:56-1372(+)